MSEHSVQNCPWCGFINFIRPMGATLCGCGHRGDLARLDCTCPECQAAREKAAKGSMARRLGPRKRGRQ